MVPVTFTGADGLIAFSFTRLGRALASRIEGRLDSTTEARLASLEAEQRQLHEALLDAHERLDFAERALASGARERLDTPV